VLSANTCRSSESRRRCLDVLHIWGWQATRRHALERLADAQRHTAASTKWHSENGQVLVISCDATPAAPYDNTHSRKSDCTAEEIQTSQQDTIYPP
jgi:hypothetical protein